MNFRRFSENSLSVPGLPPIRYAQFSRRTAKRLSGARARVDTQPALC